MLRRLAALTLLAWLAPGAQGHAATPAEPPPPLVLSFISTTSGDATLLQFGNGQAVLVNGGGPTDGATVSSYLDERRVRKLDLVISTDSRPGHVGGLADVLTSVHPGTVWQSAYEGNNIYQRNLDRLIRGRRFSSQTAHAGMTMKFGASTLTVLSPPDPILQGTGADLENNSIVFSVACGRTHVLFAGDMEAAGRAKLLVPGTMQTVRADLVVLGDCGSKLAVTGDLMRSISPVWAVDPCGAQGPDKQALVVLAAYATKLFRVDYMGTVVATCSGSTITFQTGLDRQKAHPVKPAGPHTPPTGTTPPTPVRNP